MRLLPACVIALALVLPRLATAADDDTGRLDRVGVTSGTTAYLWKVGGAWSLSETGCTDGSVAAFDPTTVGGENMLKAAMAAYLAGKEVKVHTSGCHSGWPKVTRIDVMGAS